MGRYQTVHGQQQVRRHRRELLRIKSTLSDRDRKRLGYLGRRNGWLPDVMAAEIEKMWGEYYRDFEGLNHERDKSNSKIRPGQV